MPSPTKPKCPRQKPAVLSTHALTLAREEGRAAALVGMYAAETLYLSWCREAAAVKVDREPALQDWVDMHVAPPFVSQVAVLACEVDAMPESVTDEEILDVMRDMRAHNVEMLTIGQYLQPSGGHLPVLRYVHPDTFKMFETEALKMGFKNAACGPMVRSSYWADQQAHQAGAFQPNGRRQLGLRQAVAQAQQVHQRCPGRVAQPVGGQLCVQCLAPAPTQADQAYAQQAFGVGVGIRGDIRNGFVHELILMK